MNAICAGSEYVIFFLSKSEKETRGFEVSPEGESGILMRSKNSESNPIFYSQIKKISSYGN